MRSQLDYSIKKQESKKTRAKKADRFAIAKLFVTTEKK